MEGPGVLTPVNFSVARGEILGVFGLVGAGRTELLKLIYGATRRIRGTIGVFGEEAQCPAHSKATTSSRCTCTPRQIETYQGKLSGPLLDRIDLKVLVSPFDERFPDAKDYASTTVRSKITRARRIQPSALVMVFGAACRSRPPMP